MTEEQREQNEETTEEKDETQAEDNEQETKEDETPEDKDEQQEDSEEDNENKDEQDHEQGDGLTKQEREYYTNEIEKLDNELSEIKEAKALETVKERMKAAKYTPSQIERYAHLIDKDNIQQSINELKADISPGGHKYVDPSLNNAARQNVSSNPKGQLHEIGRTMARYVSNKGKRR